MGPEPVFSILIGTVEKAVRDWTETVKILLAFNRTQIGKGISIWSLSEEPMNC
jgi:hypothetical protein